MNAWEQNNQRYLAAALAWLRCRLQRMANLFDNRDSTTGSPETTADADIDQLLADCRDAESADPPPSMIELSERFGLSRFEHEVLLLCAAMEFDTRIESLCARAQNDPAARCPTFGLAMAMFDEPAWHAVSPHGPLRYWRLIEIHQPGDTPLIKSSLRCDERIVSFIKGLNYLDDRLLPLVSSLEDVDNVPLPLSQAAMADSILSQLDPGLSSVVQLLGTDSLSKQHVAAHVAGILGVELYRINADDLPSQTSELETLSRLWQRECALLPIALYLDAGGQDPRGSAAEKTAPIKRFLDRTEGRILVDSREMISDLSTGVIDIAKPTSAEQRDIWTQALQSDESNGLSAIAEFSTRFDLSAPAIHRIAAEALTMADSPDVTVEDASAERQTNTQIWHACLAATRPQLDHLAQRIDARATWDDIVLPDTETAQLQQIAAQVRHLSTVYDDWGFREKMNRGLGISALFAGDSGTGKTMAAEVIANELKLNLYRIDLSAVVSKYIGETEKNLSRVFDAAESGGTVLFFDEADALFGRRSEVKDSHDRYANIEINYLLQRMESYRGLAILATNMKDAMDQAFVRRLRFIVNFPFPGTQQRRLIWQKAFPSSTPIEDLDYPRLAEFHLTGGSVHNISIASAFLAAEGESPVTMPLVLDATRTEFRKLDRPIPESELQTQKRNGAAT